MMLIAASWPSNSDAALMKRSGWAACGARVSAGALMVSFGRVWHGPLDCCSLLDGRAGPPPRR